VLVPLYLMLARELFYIHYGNMGARIAQLVKAWIRNLRIADSSLTVGGVFDWYRPLASQSLHVASVSSDHHGKKCRFQLVDN